MEGDKPRHFNERKLKTTIPKPNVVRIELLTTSARNRYLGGIQSGINFVQGHIVDNMNRMQLLKNKVFYGFLKHGVDSSIGMSSKWNASTDMAKLFTATKNIAPKLADAIGTALGGPAAGELSNKVTAGAIESVGVINDLLNISTTATGSASVQKFSSISVSDYSIDIGWYLPEQLDLCKQSLRILYQMIYPMQVDATQASKIVKGDNLDTLLNRLNFAQKNPQGDVPAEATKNQVDLLVDAAASLGTQISEGIGSLANDVSSTFGHNLTFDPLPVRLCVGQLMDIEPLIITSIKTSFSSELFVAKNGKHLPIFATTTISFAMWLNPRPDMKWFGLLGEEMFGDTVSEG